MSQNNEAGNKPHINVTPLIDVLLVVVNYLHAGGASKAA
jgi:biopolymer transport protein ExbD